MNEAVPHHIREEYVVQKFGGPDPDALHPDDLVEEVVIVIDRGVLISQTVTRPDAPPTVARS